ncbi:MAG TPA: NAD(P)/FAD-dependent oxidoreductase [Acidimicrobiales bacterium]|nr:NAD(P)/FAD-dependent oxidoreductase [Acidimicrobiales bacterium]
MADRYDVVVVGAGIAGSALASTLAQRGRSVLVLEQQTTYKDKVRGETLTPWGVVEATRLGLMDTLYSAGAELATQFVPYDELQRPADAEAGALPISMFCPGADGQLNVGHPEASEALSTKAAADGATVVRGVSDVKVAFGAEPTVRYTDGVDAVDVRCRLVVGADGRTSTVRRQAGLTLEERPAVTYGAGLLIHADSGFKEKNTLGTEGDIHYLAFPRAGDLTRLYLMVDIARQPEFTGPQRLEHFLAGFAGLTSFPAAAALAAGEPAGPAGGAPMTDSWTTEAPVIPGAVLIGDAAGWNDPIIGQGLSIALRDARTVADVLSESENWSRGAFDDYVAERRERMRRLAISARLMTAIRCTFTDAGRERRARWFQQFLADPLMLGQVVGMLAGPETADAASFTDEAVATTLAV